MAWVAGRSSASAWEFTISDRTIQQSGLRTQENTTWALEARSSSKSKSPNEPITGVTPNVLSFSAFSGDRTRAVILKTFALGWATKRARTDPPIYPVACSAYP